MEENQKKVPEGWEEKELGDILKYEQPYMYAVNSTEYNDKSGIPVLTAGKSFLLGYTTETEGVYSNLPVIIFDDFTTDSKYVDFPFKVKSSAMKFLKPKDETETNLKLVFEHIQSLKIRETGGDHKRRWISEFSKLKIYFPSAAEQQKIASILSKVDEAISQTEKLIAKYSRIKTGLMHDLLTKGIDEHGNIRSEETHEFKGSPLGRIPVEWTIPKAGELFDMTLGKMLNKDAKKHEEQYPYLGNKNVKWGIFDLVDLETMSFIQNEKEKYKLKKGDLLVCKGGDVGRSAIWEVDNADIFFQKALHRLRPIDNRIYTLFMYEYMIFITKKSIFNDFVSQTSIKHFTQENFRRLPVLCPPGDEQLRIIELSSRQEKLLKIERTNRSKLQSIKSGLMQDLLSGKVRVNHLIREMASA